MFSGCCFRPFRIAGFAAVALSCILAGCGGDSTTTVISEVTTTQDSEITTKPVDEGPSSKPEGQPDQVLSVKSPLSTQGIGGVLAGMSIPEASRAAGQQLVPRDDSGSSPECSYFEIQGLPEVSFMVSRGEVARVDVRNPKVATLSGIHVGDSEDALTAAYGSQLSSEHNYYAKNWTDYTFTPEDRSDKTRMIFAVDSSGAIDSIRAGRLPEVGFVEGCS